jgi:hypothetical protein
MTINPRSPRPRIKAIENLWFGRVILPHPPVAPRQLVFLIFRLADSATIAAFTLGDVRAAITDKH